MKHKLAIVLTFVLALPAAAQSPAERVAKGLLPPVIFKGEPAWTLEERMKHYNVPGVSIAVIKDFKVAWAKAYGVRDAETREPVTERTLFQAGSISKPVAAAVALEKVEQGKLRLDENINARLKSWKLPENELTAKRTVTLANLLSHTAGLTVHGFPGYAAGAAVPSLPEVLDGKAPANTAPVRVDLEPGTKFRYSGGGTTIMQLTLEDVEGRPFPEIARETILSPLGMEDSTYSQPLPEATRKAAASGHRRDGKLVPGRFHTYPEMAAAGLWTTPTDLAKFAVEMQLSLAGRSNKVLSKESVQKMVTPYISNDVGMGFFRGPASYFGHNGSDEGFTSMLVAHAEKGYGAVVMINSDSFAIMPEILRAVAREYAWEGYLPDPYTIVSVAPEKLAGYAGRYRLGPDAVLAVTAEGGRLYGQRTGFPRFELLPVSDATFVRRDEPVEYVFERDAMTRRGEASGRAPRMAKGETVPSEQLMAGRYAEAVEAYLKLKKEDPANDAVAENRLNGLGYELLQARKLPEAIAVFKLNVDLYPQSSNVYDSLGEAYMENGDKELAIANYKRSLELNPRNQNAVEMLKRLGQ